MTAVFAGEILWPMTHVNNTPAATGRIVSPRENDKVGKFVKVKGELSGIPTGHSVWLAVKIGLLLWPKDEISPSEGTWKATFDGGGGQGKEFGLALIMVGPDGERKIRKWFENGPEAGYPGLARIKGSVPLDAVSRVVLR